MDRLVLKLAAHFSLGFGAVKELKAALEWPEMPWKTEL